MSIEGLNPSDGSDSLQGKVLVVDDEPHLVGMYAAMLEDVHSVSTATSGERALEKMTDEFDVLLLDRRMPGLSGDDVLNSIREEAYTCQIAMVTSIDPGIDIVDMPFDAYMVKPIRQQDLRELVQNLLLRSEYQSDVREQFAVVSKLAALESRYTEAELESHEEYAELQARHDALQATNQRRIGQLVEGGDTGLVYRDVLGTVQDA